ncbi:MAG TPA: hypothetical protein VFR51_02505 [Pyrinomonadaceae bacterium]|nr:hypothetical protein [Pyrinomonadaceae bacterium]
MFRVLTLTIVSTLACSVVVCGQSNERRMIADHSQKNLTAEDSQADGIVQIKIGQLFKPGDTTYAVIDRKTLAGLPPLPTGFVAFRDQGYKVTTQAIASGEHAVIFYVPSVKSADEFSRLVVFHLEEDELSPLGKSWEPVTLVPGGWDKNFFQFTSEKAYGQLVPDFASRRIAAIVDEFGIFVIAVIPDTHQVPKEPFTQIEFLASSSPESMRTNEQVTHTLTIKNNGPVRAEEVNLRESVNPALEFQSATTTQGKCTQSPRSMDRVFCHLGPLDVGSTATIQIVARFFKFTNLNEERTSARSTVELVFKKKATDFTDITTQRIVDFDTVILKANP